MLHSLERGLPEPDLRTYVHAGDPHHITIGEEAFELKVGSVSLPRPCQMKTPRITRVRGSERNIIL